MGIRINKSMGYGLKDVAVENDKIIDQRINPDSPLLVNREDPREDYLAFLMKLEEGGDEDAAIEKALLSIAQEENWRSLCAWDAKCGMPEIMIIRPMGFPQWSRYADFLDTEEEVATHGPSSEPRIIELEHGIYPYSGLYIDARSGKRCPDAVNVWQRLRNAKDETPDRSKILDLVAQSMGFSGHAEAEQHVAPIIPDDIRRLCEWGNLFTSPDVWQQLRPMIYIYWS